MTHRAARLAIVLVALTAVGGAGHVLYYLDHRIAHARLDAREFDELAHRAATLLERLRAAQQAYVADGQGPDFWMKRVDELAAALERTLVGLGGAATTDTVRTTTQAAANELAAFSKLDRRAREYVRAGQRLTASDLIFTESLGATGSVISGVENARAEHQAAVQATVDELRLQQIYALGAAVGVTAIALLLLLPRAQAERPKDTREALRALIDGPAGSASLRPDPPSSPPPGARMVAPPPEAAPARPSIEPPRPGQAAPAAPASDVDLAATARLCGDMARVLDPGDLPALLKQAAGLLNASGLIVWVADRAGASLFPTLAHGYPPAALARIGAISRDADNAAAAAFRKGERQVVPQNGATPGALVTPIITAEGCVGVLAAETRNGSEGDAATRAVADILAAQLATLVTTLPGRTDEVRS